MKTILLILATIPVWAQASLLVSHKGAWGDFRYPANTEKALFAALDQGFRALEFDVVLSLDNEFIVAHDDRLNRITNCKGKISRWLARDLKHCQVNASSILPITQLKVRRTREKDQLSTLKELLTRLLNDDRVERLVIDVKDSDKEGVLSALNQLLSPLPDSDLSRLLFIGKVPQLLRQLKDQFPAVFTALEGSWGSEPVVRDDVFLNRVGLDFDVISLNVGLPFGHEPLWKLIGRRRRFERLLKAFWVRTREQEAPVMAWTINDPERIRELEALEVGHILTDLPYSELPRK